MTDEKIPEVDLEMKVFKPIDIKTDTTLGWDRFDALRKAAAPFWKVQRANDIVNGWFDYWPKSFRHQLKQRRKKMGHAKMRRRRGWR